MKIVWFEEMKKDMMTVIRDISRFIGYHMTEYKILKLDDHLYIDNFKKWWLKVWVIWMQNWSGKEKWEIGRIILLMKITRCGINGLLRIWKGLILSYQAHKGAITTWTECCNFLTPPPCVDRAWTKTVIFWPPSTCPRSSWMAPNLIDFFLKIVLQEWLIRKIKIIVKDHSL